MRPRVDPRLVAVRVVPDAKRHRDLLERRDARPLAEAVDRALGLRRAGTDPCERVRDGEPEIVVTVDSEGHLVELGAEAADLGHERGVLVGERVPHGVRQVDRRRAGSDCRAADLGDERGVGAGRVLARELDLVDAAVDVGDRLARLVHHLLGLEPELELHVDRARREHDVHARPAARDGECLDGGIEVVAARPRERRDGGSAHGRCDCAHAFEVARGGDGEPRLDHVDPQLVERVGDLDLLVRREDDARRLLAVSQGGVENRDPAVPHWLLLRSGPPRGRTSPALRSVCAPRGA